MKIDWLVPWEAIEDKKNGYASELHKELSPQHKLYKNEVTAIAKRVDCDDVLFKLEDETFAVVHLTWSGKRDQDSNFPWTVLYTSLEEFVNNAMAPDANEYKLD